LRDALSYVTRRFEVLVTLAAIGGANLYAQPLGVLVDGVEDAAILLPQDRTSLRIGRGAEQALEQRTGAALHRHRRGVVAPRDRVVISAAIGGLARAQHIRRLQADLDRGELGLFAEFLR